MTKRNTSIGLDFYMQKTDRADCSLSAFFHDPPALRIERVYRAYVGDKVRIVFKRFIAIRKKELKIRMRAGHFNGGILFLFYRLHRNDRFASTFCFMNINAIEYTGRPYIFHMEISMR